MSKSQTKSDWANRITLLICRNCKLFSPHTVEWSDDKSAFCKCEYCGKINECNPASMKIYAKMDS